jgi:hypothetical protein
VSNTKMIEEHTEVVLTRDVPEKGLEAGDVGTVVSVHEGTAEQPPGYTLEFFSVTGETLTVATVEAGAVRAAERTEILHARSLGA